MFRKQFVISCALLGLVLFASTGRADDAAARSVDVVVEWNRTLLSIIRTPGAQPPTVHPTRSFAIMHAAIYDAVNSIVRTHTPYVAFVVPASHDASVKAAAAAAAHRVLVVLYPAFQSALDAELQRSLAHGSDRRDAEGIRIGEAAADQILARRSADGSAVQPPAYTFGSAPGDYQSTPPNFPKQPVFTHWPAVTPFALMRADQFRPAPPPALTSETYRSAFNEIRSLGIANSATATPDEELTGRFWNAAIQNYWNEIAQTASLSQHLSTVQSARLFALLNLSFADGVIAFYDAKYAYNFWRPITAIRAADTDGNPETEADPNWLPEVGTTPSDPSYPGAHAVISAAGATVLSTFFDRDHFELTVTSELLPGVERSFSSFSAAADEATLSRVFAGVHFRTDLTSGERLGRDVADFVLDHFLTPRRQRDTK
ncbi:MAG TPA: vanadium-dependent haloperoxidase [Vicinamibacterales bacterium]|jgi:membrane-associated phospholipid phosphatase|nr:vanadium-dependent haloperoxidase [Vicinamibacterales bacterium]